MDALKRLLLMLLRYPGEPAAPEGTPGSVRSVASSRRYLAYRLVKVWAGLLFVFAIEELAVGSVAKGHGGIVVNLIVFLILVGIPGATGSFVSYVDYATRYYLLSDRALRIREGIFTVRETTMSFANIQNVSVSRGPLQGLFGISDVVMKTAGGGTSRRSGLPKADHHLAHFRGLTNADEVRELVLQFVKKTKDAGLGDGDAPPSAAAAPSLEIALRDLRAAAKAFRETADELASKP